MTKSNISIALAITLTRVRLCSKLKFIAVRVSDVYAIFSIYFSWLFRLFWPLEMMDVPALIANRSIVTRVMDYTSA